MGNTVLPFQGIFVKGRKVLDAVLLTNEVVEEYRILRNKMLIVKVDFEKSFDLEYWDFLDSVFDKT